MSDDTTLRTRIAEVLNSFPADFRPTAVVNLEKADAVIAELGLTEDEADTNVTRYVTPWKANDD